MKKTTERHPAFEITEEPHTLDAALPAGNDQVWQDLGNKVMGLEQQVLEVEASLRNMDEKHTSARRKLLLSLIEDVMDNLDRSLAGVDPSQADPTTQRWIKRQQRTRRAVEQLLEREQVSPTDPVRAPDGLVFTREEVERDDVPDGTIVEVDYRGYLWRGELLRKASVVRARNSRPSRTLETRK